MRFVLSLLAVTLALAPLHDARASSHREAPGILSTPQVDGTDFYMFRSYEEGRSGFVTLIANYNPLQDPFGGPNYFPLDSNARYSIHVDNDGDGTPNISFHIKPSVESRNLAIPVGPPGQEVMVEVPVQNIGPVFVDDDSNLNQDRAVMIEAAINGRSQYVRNLGTDSERLGVPFDYIGEKTFPDYETYADSFVHDIWIPGCGNGRAFVGQRKDPFVVNLGETFDLLNLEPLFPTDDEEDDLRNKNITSIALELPIACLVPNQGSSIISGWTTSGVVVPGRTGGGAIQRGGVRVPVVRRPEYVQVSRLANPLVNEVAIGVPDKNLFNASQPGNDQQFLRYVTHPTLPELMQALFDVEAPNNFPRNDLVAVFLSGIPGVNEDGSVGEVMRLNTATPPTETFDQDPMGLLAGDAAGYPNGRRVGDDVVDISLRAMMGALCHAQLGLCDPEDAPSGDEEFTDGAFIEAGMFPETFPYLNTPLPGSPNGEGQT